MSEASAARSSMTPGRVDLVKGDDDLECDKDQDDQSEAQRSAGVDDVGERVGGLGDHRELAVEGIDALLQFVFVFKPGVKPLQIGTVPQRIRFFSACDAARYPVLDQQRIADQLQNLFPVPAGASV